MKCKNCKTDCNIELKKVHIQDCGWNFRHGIITSKHVISWNNECSCGCNNPEPQTSPNADTTIPPKKATSL